MSLTSTKVHAVSLVDAIAHRPALLEAAHLAVRVARAVADRHLAAGPYGQLTPWAIEVFSDTVRLHEPPATCPATRSAAYRPPESFLEPKARLDVSGDLYALGVILYELFAGRPPFTAQDLLEWRHAHLAIQVPPLASVQPQTPAGFGVVIERLLAKRPADRYQNAPDVVHDLAGCLTHLLNPGPLAPVLRTLRERPVPSSPVHGRSADLAQLNQALTKVHDSGKPLVVALSGHPGMGKSVIAGQVLAGVSQRGGLAGIGQFDWRSEELPYSCLPGMFAGLVEKILTGAADAEQLRHHVLEGLGPPAGLVTHVLPALERLIGPQPSVQDSEYVTAPLRFPETMRRLVEVLAATGSQLALCFDDVQWADPSSLALIRRLIAEPGLPRLIVILVYRPDPGVESRLNDVLEVRSSSTTVLRLQIGPLDQAGMGELVADALCEPVDAVRELAQLVYARSRGNPFEAIQVLSELQVEGVIRYDAQRLTWEWDLRGHCEETAEGAGTDLTDVHLGRMPSATRTLLAAASCIRGEASLDLLAGVTKVPVEEVRSRLIPAVEANLVATDGRVARFVHDRVRHAAYRIPSQRHRRTIQLALAQVLRASSGPALNERIFDVVEQYVLTGHSPRDPVERREVVGLLLEAGLRALVSGAFTAARRYCNEARRRLREVDWWACRQLAVDVYLAEAKAAFAQRDLKLAEQLTERAHRQARTPAQRGAACVQLIELYGLQGKATELVELGIEDVARCGLRIPKHPGPERAAAAYWPVNRQLAATTADDLARLPECRDEHIRTTMQTLSALAVRTIQFDGDLSTIGLATVMELTLRHGLTPEAPYALASLALITCGRYRRCAQAWQFIEAAVRLADLPAYRPYRVEVMWQRAVIACWSRSPAKALSMLIHSMETARGLGRPDSISYSLYWQARELLFTDRPLEEVAERISDAQRYVRGLGEPFIEEGLDLLQWFVARLQGALDATDRLTTTRERARASYDIQFLQTATRAYLLAMEGQHEQVLALAEEGAWRTQPPVSPVQQADLTFWWALASAGAATGASADRREHLLERIESDLAELREWAAAAPERYGVRAALLDAEHARLADDEAAASRGYEDALRQAQASGQLAMEALTAHTAARFYATTDRPTVAAAFRGIARTAYARWGATARVAALDSEDARAAATGDRSGEGETLALVRALQAISATVQLDDLLHRLMPIVLQESGGDFASLVLLRTPRPELTADARIGRDGSGIQVRVYPAGTAAEAASLPSAVVTAVIESKSPVHLNDAEAAAVGRGNPSAVRPVPKSLLCLPMLHQGALCGLLYVENTLLPYAFSPSRRAVLDLLAAQAAISIENAITRRELQAGEERYRALLEAAPDAIVTTDAQGAIVLANSQAERLFGYPRSDLIGRPLDTVLTTISSVAAGAAIDRRQGIPAQVAAAPVSPVRREGIHSEGERFPVETTTSCTGTATGPLSTTIVRDIREQHRVEEQLRHLADHDSLTGLFNRRRLETELEAEVARVRRYGSDAALLIVDLDNFKDINDLRGHHAGDHVLRIVAGVFRDRTRACDIVARLGGDEFGILLPQTSTADAGRLAEELLGSLASLRVALPGPRIHLTASIGVAGLCEATCTTADVLAAADVALYDAKERGRAQVAVHDTNRPSAVRDRIAWTDRLRTALDQDQLLLYRQPILDLRINEVTKCELLLRLATEDPSRVIAPATFLPIAERTGLITRIDRWVISKAIRLLTSPCLEGLTVAINLSSPSLSDRTLPHYVAGLLADHPAADPTRLTFEITETSVIANMDEAVTFAQQLRHLGCGLALDDFGVGFGSFYYLKHLPLDALKLAGDFVRAVRYNAIDPLIVDAMVSIAKGLGLATVAEQVPDEPTCRWLADHGVDYAQGYWIGHPEPIP